MALKGQNKLTLQTYEEARIIDWVTVQRHFIIVHVPCQVVITCKTRTTEYTELLSLTKSKNIGDKMHTNNCQTSSFIKGSTIVTKPVRQGRKEAQ